MAKATDGQVSLIAVGDLMPNREVPESIFELSAPVLKRYDVRFGQLEINLSDRGCPNSACRVPAKAPTKNVRALKFAGFDAIIITGASEKPIYLWVHDGKYELRDATYLWGTDCHDTHFNTRRTW